MKEQVTPAEYPEGYLLRAFTTCLILQLEISYVPTRSEQTANANLSMSQGPKPRKTNIAIYFNITCQMLFSVLHPHVSYGSHIWHKGSNPPPEGKLSFNVIFHSISFSQRHFIRCITPPLSCKLHGFISNLQIFSPNE